MRPGLLLKAQAVSWKGGISPIFGGPKVIEYALGVGCSSQSVDDSGFGLSGMMNHFVRFEVVRR